MTRRLIAYLTLGIFLLNLLGYYGIFVGAKKLSGQRVADRLDSEMYDLGGNMTVKVPMPLPYHVEPDYFDRTDGEFELEGEVYRIIKQRHYNDTLYVVLIKDEQTSKINSALSDYVEAFAGQDDGEGQVSAPGLIKDFVSEKIAVANSNIGWVESIQLTTQSPILFDAYFASIVHPPERQAC